MESHEGLFCPFFLYMSGAVTDQHWQGMRHSPPMGVGEGEKERISWRSSQNCTEMYLHHEDQQGAEENHSSTPCFPVNQEGLGVAMGGRGSGHQCKGLGVAACLAEECWHAGPLVHGAQGLESQGGLILGVLGSDQVFEGHLGAGASLAVEERVHGASLAFKNGVLVSVAVSKRISGIWDPKQNSILRSAQSRKLMTLST